MATRIEASGRAGVPCFTARLRTVPCGSSGTHGREDLQSVCPQVDMLGCRLGTRWLHEMTPNCFPTLRQFAGSHSHRESWEFLPGLGLAKRSGFCQADGQTRGGLSSRFCLFVVKTLLLPPIGQHGATTPTTRGFPRILSSIRGAKRTLERHRLSPTPASSAASPSALSFPRSAPASLASDTQMHPRAFSLAAP